MSISGISSSNTMRLTGLATGMDTDEMVKKMMQADNLRVDKAKQDVQQITWKQEIYRDIIKQVKSFQSKYFDVLSSDYLLSGKNIAMFNVTTPDTTKSVELSASVGAVPGDYSVKVENLAKAAKVTGAVLNVKEAASEPIHKFLISPANKTVTLTGYGDITLDEGNFTVSELAGKINEKISSEAYNSDIRAVVGDNNNIEIVKKKTLIDASNNSLTLNTSSGKSYTVNIDNGEYTFEDLTAKINKSLADQGASTKEVGAAFDGKKILFINESGDNIAHSRDYIAEVVTDATTNVNALDKKVILGSENNTLTIKIGGESTFNIFLNASDDLSAIVADINDKLHTDPDGAGPLLPNTTSSTLRAELSNDGKKIRFVSNENKTIQLSGSAMESLGLPSSLDLNMSTLDKASSLIDNGESGKVTFTINNGSKDIVFKYDFTTNINDDITGYKGVKDKNIDYILKDISAQTGLKMTYSQLTKSFTLEEAQTGAGNDFAVKLSGDDDSKAFLGRLFNTNGSALASDIDKNNSIYQVGEDAKVTIENPAGTSVTLFQSKNSFTIDGITYNLNAETASSINFTVAQNVDESFNKISKFIDSYNEMIDKINTIIKQKKNYDYKPLTDEQKKNMSEDSIKAWEEKAKEGLLKGDTELGNILYQLRSAFYEKVEGVNTSFSKYEIGIETSSDVTEGGKIVISDPDKLKDALRNNGQEVLNLFIQKSSNVPTYTRDLANSQRTQRHEEEGIFNRLNDIINDYVTTSRDKMGNKGILLEKAGIEKDASLFLNLFSKQIEEKNKAIQELNSKLIEKENRYYQQFARLEEMMNNMNSQSNWLAQQLGMSQG